MLNMLVRDSGLGKILPPVDFNLSLEDKVKTNSNFQHKKESKLMCNQGLTRIHVGNRGYDPVVRTSMAKGMAKLGRRAWTRASLAREASLSAVSTNKMVC